MQPQVAWNSERGLTVRTKGVQPHLAQSLRSLNKGRWGNIFFNTFRFYQAGVESDYIGINFRKDIPSLIQFY